MVPTENIKRHLTEPVSAASLVVYRSIFSICMFIGVLRQFYYGWIEEFYVQPSFFFSYPGFSWLSPGPSWFMFTAFALMALASLAMAVGFRTRLFAIIFFLLFTYTELIDKTTYLNHYYLVSILALFFILVPLQDSFRGAVNGKIQRFWLYGFRAQVGVVYFFAGVAKLNYDWLVLAQPLSIWLKASTDLAVIGPLLGYKETAYFASWAGAAFDLSIPFLLCFKRTRLIGFSCIVFFHFVTGALFNLGLFPYLMMVNATLFFSPAWPRWILDKLRLAARTSRPSKLKPIPRAILVFFTLHFIIQCLLPLRHHLYQGNHLWTEQGFRFSWMVMLIEKAGMVRYELTYDDGSYEMIYPSEYLTKVQSKMMSTQADMIVQFAHHLRDRNSQPSKQVTKVTADAVVALNGRRSQKMFDPDLNLLDVPISDAGLFVLPLKNPRP